MIVTRFQRIGTRSGVRRRSAFSSMGAIWIRQLFYRPLRFPQQGSTPLAGRSLIHRLAASVSVRHPRAALQQQLDDAGLLFTRLRRTAPSSAGGLNGKVQWRRSRLVWLPRVRPAIEERSHSRQGARAHRSVQRRDAGIVHGVGICADRHEVFDDGRLSRRVPSVGIRRIVKRLRPSAIFCAPIGSVRNQEFRNRAPKCRGSHVKGRIAGIEVVSDVGKEKSRGLLTRRPNARRSGGQSRTASQAPGHLVDVSVHDDADEIRKC